MLEVQSIDHQETVLSFSFFVVLDHPPFLKLGSRDLPIQEVFLFLKVLLTNLTSFQILIEHTFIRIMTWHIWGLHIGLRASILHIITKFTCLMLVAFHIPGSLLFQLRNLSYTLTFFHGNFQLLMDWLIHKKLLSYLYFVWLQVFDQSSWVNDTRVFLIIERINWLRTSLRNFLMWWLVHYDILLWIEFVSTGLFRN